MSQMPIAHRLWLLMPLMHSEAVEDQEASGAPVPGTWLQTPVQAVSANLLHSLDVCMAGPACKGPPKMYRGVYSSMAYPVIRQLTATGLQRRGCAGV